jgi:hypothetical protein
MDIVDDLRRFKCIITEHIVPEHIFHIEYNFSFEIPFVQLCTQSSSFSIHSCFQLMIINGLVNFFNLIFVYYSSVGIVSDYSLESQGIGF